MGSLADNVTIGSVAKVVRICEERRRGAVRLDGGVEGHSAEDLGSGHVLQSRHRGDGDVLRSFHQRLKGSHCTHQYPRQRPRSTCRILDVSRYRIFSGVGK